MLAVLSLLLRRVGLFLFAHFIARVLVGAGLSLVAYHVAIGPLFDQLHSITDGAGSTALAWFGYFNIDKAITVLISAYTIRLTAKSLHLVKN